MDLIDIVLGVYLALVMHSLTMAWLTANGTRSVADGVRCLMDPAAATAATAADKEYFEWYVDQERRIRERDWQEQQYYQQQQQIEEMSLRGATQADWNAAQTAWGGVCQGSPPGSPQNSPQNTMLPATAAYAPPARPQVPRVTELPTVRGTLQTPVPTTGLPTSSQPLLQPLMAPPDDDDGYGAILSG
jgi:hypothetical protein